MHDDNSPPKAGDRFVVKSEFAAIVLTLWRAPYTGGDDRFIPAGLEFTVENDPLPEATGVGVKPDPYGSWELVLVDESTRLDEKYDGYVVIVGFEELARHCERQRQTPLLLH